MSDVHGNPDEIRLFATHLRQFSSNLGELRGATLSRMADLNQSWKDRENSEFVDRYREVIGPLDPLIATLDEYAAFLVRKAAALDSYLNTKL